MLRLAVCTPVQLCMHKTYMIDAYTPSQSEACNPSSKPTLCWEFLVVLGFIVFWLEDDTTTFLGGAADFALTAGFRFLGARPKDSLTVG